MGNVSGFTLTDEQGNIAQSQLAAIAVYSKLIVRSNMGHERLGFGCKVSLAGLEFCSIANGGKFRFISVDNRGHRAQNGTV